MSCEVDERPERCGLERRRLRALELSEVDEQLRVQEATDRLRGVPELEPQRWQGLDPLARKWTLDHAGRELEQVYGSPRPPLLEQKAMPERLHGCYQDDDWLMKVNERLLTSDHPREALETYLHEFRHSYQHLEVQRLKGPIRPDDVGQAVEWEQNLSPEGYRSPPEEILAVTDPERYESEFQDYEDQPVERDARQFADEIIRRLYGEDWRP